MWLINPGRFCLLMTCENYFEKKNLGNNFLKLVIIRTIIKILTFSILKISIPEIEIECLKIIKNSCQCIHIFFSHEHVKRL